MFALIAGITRGQTLQYLFLPQVLPRLTALYSSGFANLAYLIALVYRAVNILPANHVVLSRAARNNLSIRAVLGAAASELKFDLRHIDQVIVYFAVLLGMVLLAGQFILTLGYIMVNPAMAAGTVPTTYAGFFASPQDDDVAYKLLLTVFGIPELFNTGPGNVGVGFGYVQNEYNTALQALFQFYSFGLLVIAVFIICYYIFAVLAETAETGVPFGKRYNHVWTPIRLVMALGLLIPISYGLNTAQWITLYSAKLGSDFATRGWLLFNEKMNEVYLNTADTRVGTPNPPNFMPLAGYMMTVNACAYAYEKIYGDGPNKKEINAYLVKSPAEGSGEKIFAKYKGGGSFTTFDDAHTYFNKGDIVIRFGQFKQPDFAQYRGNVYPYCGDIVIYAGDTQEPGSLSIQQNYYQQVQRMFGDWSDTYKLNQSAKAFVDRFTADQNPTAAGATAAMAATLPGPDFKQDISERLNSWGVGAISAAVSDQATSPTWTSDREKIQKLGWAGAGIWYNKIAQINGSLVTGINNTPQPRSMPSVMEYMRREQLQQNQNVPNPNRTQLSEGRQMQFNTAEDRKIAMGLEAVDSYWREEPAQRVTHNIFIDVINVVFGTRGLFDMCKNADIHPLAQLSILGKGLVESSIRNLGLAAGFGALSALPVPFLGAASGAAASILLSVATITITMGFILFYVLPFMPFLYFFFAVGGWVKGIFEAMVGVPLWALAHLRIDGEGLPGDAAMTGYILISEIFLRPILIVFGLLASIVIFSSMVKVLNSVYSLVVVNLAGHSDVTATVCGNAAPVSNSAAVTGNNDTMAYFRGPIDELFFTVVYAIIVYMIGMSCFKLIDLIPNNLLRFMGTPAQSFNDLANDDAQGMLGKLAIGSSVVSDRVLGEGGIVRSGASAGGRTIEAGAGFISPPAQGGR